MPNKTLEATAMTGIDKKKSIFNETTNLNHDQIKKLSKKHSALEERELTLRKDLAKAKSFKQAFSQWTKQANTLTSNQQKQLMESTDGNNTLISNLESNIKQLQTLIEIINREQDDAIDQQLHKI